MTRECCAAQGVIAAIGRRDAATASACILGALVLGTLAIISRERDRYDG
jgi:hypothetical protein